MSDDSWRARVGSTIGGWKLGPQVGKGGMGIVVKCSKKVDGHVILGLAKLPFATSVGEEWALRRHHAEVEVMTVVKGCINVVQILDHGVDGGIHYYVMEYVHGADLFKFSRAVWRNEQRFQPAMVAWLLGELLYGLADVHDLVEAGKPKGIIHKDIKPPNILVSTKGALKIGDFGIATTGAMLGLSLRGTKQYMAPEHYHGYPQSRSDVWGALATAWELLARRPLRNGETEEQIARQVGMPPAGPPCEGLSDAFVQLFADGLALLPEQRFDAKDGAARVEALPEYKMMRTRVGAFLCENVRRLDGSGRTDMLVGEPTKMSKDVAGLFAAERVYMEAEDDEGKSRGFVVVRGEPQLVGPPTVDDGASRVPEESSALSVPVPPSTLRMAGLPQPETPPTLSLAARVPESSRAAPISVPATTGPLPPPWEHIPAPPLPASSPGAGPGIEWPTAPVVAAPVVAAAQPGASPSRFAPVEPSRVHGMGRPTSGWMPAVVPERPEELLSERNEHTPVPVRSAAPIPRSEPMRAVVSEEASITDEGMFDPLEAAGWFASHGRFLALVIASALIATVSAAALAAYLIGDPEGAPAISSRTVGGPTRASQPVVVAEEPEPEEPVLSELVDPTPAPAAVVPAPTEPAAAGAAAATDVRPVEPDAPSPSEPNAPEPVPTASSAEPQTVQPRAAPRPAAKSVPVVEVKLLVYWIEAGIDVRIGSKQVSLAEETTLNIKSGTHAVKWRPRGTSTWTKAGSFDLKPGMRHTLRIGSSKGVAHFQQKVGG